MAPALSAGFSAAAMGLGYGSFAPAAGAFGGYLGQKFKDITGYGDYTVRRNSLMSGTVPSVGNPSDVPNGLCISHREYLGDVITSSSAGAFAISSFVMSPSNPQCWEWLAQIACNYEEWIPEGILFYFKSTSGDALNSVNTALGTVIMATNYNPYNAPFASKAEMESYEFCTNGPPSSDLIHMVECDPHEGAISTYFMSFLNQSGQNSNMDKRFNQLGTFYLATVGFQGASVNIGELWVTYQVTLLKPKLYQSLGFADDFIKIYGNMSASTASGLVQNGSAGVVVTSDNTMPYTSTSASNGLYFSNGTNITNIYFPVYPFATKYLLAYYLTGSSGAVPLVTFSGGAGDYPAAYAPQAVQIVQGPASGVTAANLSVSCAIYVPGGFIKSPLNGNSPFISMQFSVTWGGSTPFMVFYLNQSPYILALTGSPS